MVGAGEAQAMSAVDHPNFASVYDIGEWNGQLFIAMPYAGWRTIPATTFRDRT